MTYDEYSDVLLSGGHQFQNPSGGTPSGGNEVIQELEWFDLYSFEWFSDGTPDNVQLFVRLYNSS